MAYNYTNYDFRPYYGTNDPNDPYRYSQPFQAPPVPTYTAPAPSIPSTPSLPNSFQNNRLNGLSGGQNNRSGDADRVSGGSFREVPTGQGSFSVPESSFGIRDVLGGLGGLFGTGGALIGNLAGAAINPSGYFDTGTVNVPGYGPYATKPGPLSAFLSAIPGANLTANIFGKGSLNNIADVLSGKTDGIVGDFSQSGGGLASYNEGAFGLNGNFGTGAQARANQAAIAKAYYDKSKKDKSIAANKQANASLKEAGVSLGGKNINADKGGRDKGGGYDRRNDLSDRKGAI